MDEKHIDMVVEITDVDEIAEYRKTPRTVFPVKVIALLNVLFEIAVGVPYIFLMSWVGDDFGAVGAVIGGLVFAAAHTAASVVCMSSKAFPNGNSCL